MECGLCKKLFALGSNQFYTLQSCGHGYCLNCIFLYAEKQLEELNQSQQSRDINKDSQQNSAEDNNNNNNNNSNCNSNSNSNDSNIINNNDNQINNSKSDDDHDHSNSNSNNHNHNKKVASNPLLCPSELCRLPVSIDDLKKALIEFGEKNNNNNNNNNNEAIADLGLDKDESLPSNGNNATNDPSKQLAVFLTKSLQVCS